MVLVTLDLPEKLIEEIKHIEKLYGVKRDDIIRCALKRYMNNQLQLYTEALGRNQKETPNQTKGQTHPTN